MILIIEFYLNLFFLSFNNFFLHIIGAFDMFLFSFSRWNDNLSYTTISVTKLDDIKYALRWWEWIQFDRIRWGKDKINSWSRMKKMLAINFYPLVCDELLSYKKQNYYWPGSSYLNYFKKPYILPLREELHVEEILFLNNV